MIIRGQLVYFNHTQYEKKGGFSYGFAKSPDREQQIFLGTNFRMFPVIVGDKVVMSRIPNRDTIDLTRIEGAGVVIEPRELKKGPGGHWCFAEEWTMMEDSLKTQQERKRVAMAAVEAERIRAAAEEAARRFEEGEKKRARITENPRTVEQALEHGWEAVPAGSENDPQVILRRLFPGESHPRQITRHQKDVSVRQRKRRAASRFATV